MTTYPDELTVAQIIDQLENTWTELADLHAKLRERDQDPRSADSGAADGIETAVGLVVQTRESMIKVDGILRWHRTMQDEGDLAWHRYTPDSVKAAAMAMAGEQTAGEAA